MHRSMVLSTPAFGPLIPLAQAAEAAGFHRLWTTESTSRDAIIRAVTLGLHTQAIGVASGIAYAFTRAPLALAATAADAHIATGGRFTLGIGAGTKGMRTSRYGICDFDHAGSRIGDYARLIRAAWASPGPFSYQGAFYAAKSDVPLRGDELAGLPPIPIVGSGVNAAMLRLSARHCDGVALHPLVSQLSYLDRVALPAITSAGRLDGSAWIAAWRITSVHSDELAAAERARRNLAFYFSTPSYASVAEGGPWHDVVTTIRERFRADRSLGWAELAREVPDRMVEDFCLVGTPENLAAKAAVLERSLDERGIGEVVFQVAGLGLTATEFAESARWVLRSLALR
jgi:alkanesulfonate monooxygenase SsuD/methylene tetrahydromethanopterin reductase-like flavin-dependent oxidoreductase (luciferase family)